MKNEEAILAELDALKTRVAALEANAGLVVKPAAGDVAPAKFVEPQVSITHPIETSPITLPTETEYRGILAAVRDAYPQLWRPSNNPRFTDQDEAEFFRDFCAVFERVSYLRRTAEVDSKHSLSWWVDEINRRLHGRQIDGAAFLAAVIGAGDVSFVQRDEYGNAWAFGLATFGGRPATEAWQRVLKGQLLTPVAGKFGGPGPRPSVRLEAEQ